MEQLYEGAAPVVRSGVTISIDEPGFGSAVDLKIHDASALRPLLAAITHYHLTASNAQSVTIGL